MTCEGFFLKLKNGGYYFLSDLVDEQTYGNIWVQNRKGHLSDYYVSYTLDGVTSIKFGHFSESISTKTITYRDLKTEKAFALNFTSGERLYI